MECFLRVWSQLHLCYCQVLWCIRPAVWPCLITHWPLEDWSKFLDKGLSNKLVNPLAPERFKQNFRLVIFKLISVIDGWGISCKIALRWMPLQLTDDKSTLVQVMAWYSQATSHCLSQCWPRFMSQNGVTRPQWVKPCYKGSQLYQHTEARTLQLVQKKVGNSSVLAIKLTLTHQIWPLYYQMNFFKWKCLCLQISLNSFFSSVDFTVCLHWFWIKTTFHFCQSKRMGHKQQLHLKMDIDRVVQDCGNSTANALELLPSCSRASIWWWYDELR